MMRFCSGLVFGLLLVSACTKSEPTVTERPPSPSSSVAGSTPAQDPEVARFHVQALTCEGCAATLRGILKPHPGVVDVDTNVRARSLIVTYDPQQISPAEIAAILKKADYDTEPLPAADALALP